MPRPDINQARQFLAAHARVLDRRRLERLLDGAPPEPVRDAVAAYRNPDGGFGHGLEPDGRGPGSQPIAVALALQTLHEADAWDPDLARGACDWLERTAPAAGGATFADPSAEGWPHAPWFRPSEGLATSVTITGQIASPLHARGFEHPWLERATEWMWSTIDEIAADAGTGLEGIGGGYQMLGVTRFLDRVPDRDRAAAAIDRVGPLLFDRGLVELDPDAAGETHGPLVFAPSPDSIARSLFDPATITVHLDRLVADQRDDGGWTFDWDAWSPAAEADWRGSVTVDALRTLQVNGRLGE